MPYTPTQETFFAATMKYRGEFIKKRSFQLKEGVDVRQLQESWKKLVMLMPMLRTRKASLDGGDFCLVVVQEDIILEVYASLSNHKTTESKQGARPSGPLAWIVWVQTPETSSYILIWTTHHSLYDAWSFELMLDQ